MQFSDKMSKNHCTNCGRPIKKLYGRCQNCQKRYYDKKKKKHYQKVRKRFEESTIGGINKIKELARRDTWCSTHKNCFRASFGKSENKAHRDKKYERWCHHRERGRSVFTELVLKSGLRPDLVIVDNKGMVWVEEVVNSESDESVVSKMSNYPFKVVVIKC